MTDNVQSPPFGPVPTRGPSAHATLDGSPETLVTDVANQVELDRPQALVGKESREALCRDGIVILPSPFASELVENARNAALELELVRDRPGVRKVFQAANTVAAFDFFFKAAGFAELFDGLLEGDAVSLKNAVQLRIDQNVPGKPISTFHLDAISPRYKVFLYLSDVAGNDGPLEYFKATHIGDWRKPYCDEVYEAMTKNRTGEYLTDYSGCLKSTEEQERLEKTFEKIRVVGPKGTCVIFDTRGFHRASPFKDGSRLILSMHWIKRGNFV